jgi:tRNA(Ile)-lysidine synthase TilS/MesJ
MSEINDKRFLEKVRQKVGKAIMTYGLIAENDRILLGVSGGKDSLALLEILSFRKKFLPVHFDLFAVHIRVQGIPYETDLEYISGLCRELDVPFFSRETSIDLDVHPKKQPCFICSWTRRKELFYLANELTCNKVALGHHLDDILETLLLNMTFHGAISTMPPKLYIFKGHIEIIRPLALVTDKEMRHYAKIRGYRLQEKPCPYSEQTRRTQVRHIIGELEKMNKLAKINLYRSMSRIEEDYLPEK